MASIANLLLEITGDADSAQRELEEVAGELAAFGRTTAEAEADVDTTPARTALDVAEKRLKAFAATKVSAQANVDIAKALVDIQVLQAELEELDREDVEVDVQVRKSVIDRIRALNTQIESLGDAADHSSGGIRRFFRPFGDGESTINQLTGRLKLLLRLLPALITGIGALGGAAVGLVASLGRAILGAGALGVALGSTLPAFIAIGIGAVARFKDTVDKAGSAAHELARVAARAGEAFAHMTARGADRIFEGMAAALRDLTPMLRRLTPEFTRLGGAIGRAFRTLGEEFSNPAWERFFSFMTRSAARLTPLFTRAFVGLARILRNIATASMPFLIEAFRDLARFLGEAADKSSNLGALRRVIGGLVSSTRTWVDLLGGIADLFAGVMQAAGPFGDELVRWLADGARALGKWLRSDEGMKRVAAFFKDTMPLVKALVGFVGKLVQIFLQLSQLLAPLLTPLVKGLTEVLELFSDFLELLLKIPGPIRGIIGTVIGFAVGLGKVRVAGKLLAGALNFLVGGLRVLGGVFGDVLGIVRRVASAVARAVRNGFNAAREAVVNAARAIFERVRSIFGNVLEAARRIWQAIRDAIKNAFTAARDAVGNIARAIFDRITSVFGNILEAARRIWGNVKEAIANLFGAARDVVGNILSSMFTAVANVLGNIFEKFRTVLGNIVEFIRGLAERFFSAAKTLGQKVIDGVVAGIKGAIGLVKDAARSIWEAVKDIVTAPIEMVIKVKVPDLPTLPGGLGGSLGGVDEIGNSALQKGASALTRRARGALAGLNAAPLASVMRMPTPAAATAGGDTYELNITTVGGGDPDPEATLAKLSVLLQARGGLGG